MRWRAGAVHGMVSVFRFEICGKSEKQETWMLSLCEFAMKTHFSQVFAYFFFTFSLFRSLFAQCFFLVFFTSCAIFFFHSLVHLLKEFFFFWARLQFIYFLFVCVCAWRCLCAGVHHFSLPYFFFFCRSFHPLHRICSVDCFGFFEFYSICYAQCSLILVII